MKYDVITIGSTTYDSFLETELETIKWKTPSGKAYVIPTGEKLRVDNLHTTPGGNAANASVTFARHGFKTAIMTRIGDDIEGQSIVNNLKKEKVETKHIKKSENKPTARGTILLENGGRTIFSYRGAINEFSIKDIDFTKLKAKWIYVSLPGDSYTLFSKLAKEAHKNGIKVAINPSGQHLKEGGKQLIKDLKNVSLLLVNDGEAATLTGISFTKSDKVFKKLDELMPGLAVVTLGPKGVIASDGKYMYKAGTYKEKRIADRTGAGDSFGSGLVAGLIEKSWSIGGKPEDVEHAIKFASANATSVVEYIGATPGILTKNKFNKESRWRKFKIETQEIN